MRVLVVMLAVGSLAAWQATKDSPANGTSATDSQLMSGS
jgi:hypothetical protein